METALGVLLGFCIAALTAFCVITLLQFSAARKQMAVLAEETKKTRESLEVLQQIPAAVSTLQQSIAQLSRAFAACEKMIPLGEKMFIQMGILAQVTGKFYLAVVKDAGAKNGGGDQSDFLAYDEANAYRKEVEELAKKMGVKVNEEPGEEIPLESMKGAGESS
jgi:hypothetical protein